MTGTPDSQLFAPVDVLLYVQHLLGIGHLRRASVLAAGLRRAGLTVVLVTGGPPVPTLQLDADLVVQLPPVRALDETFALVDADGAALAETAKAARRDILLDTLARWRPRCLLIELFPFGRRQMRFELLPLLEAAREMTPRPVVATSLRDILNRPSNAEKLAWMLETFARHFNFALVHGDPAFLPLEASFPPAAAIAERLRYSGYVVAEIAEEALDPNAGSGEVLVSAGGGAVGRPLAEAALGARALSTLAAKPWRVLVGHNLAEAEFAALRERAAKSERGGITVERARPDFLALLARCRLSISQAGYNTMMEVLSLARPAVVVPFAAGGETEQSQRAEALAAKGLLEVVAEADLTPASLAAAVDRAAARRPEQSQDLDLGGAATSAAILRRALAVQIA